jgi:hypothetical protein
MSGVLTLTGGNIVDDLLGCFGLEEGSVSVYLCISRIKGWLTSSIDARRAATREVEGEV